MSSICFSIVTVILNPDLGDLRNTIDSVVNQDFGNWELIIKNGGSNNGFLEIIPTDQRIKVISSSDISVYDAMNQAIREASGDYICLLNSGDYFFNNNILSKISEIQAASKNIDFIFGDVNKPQSRTGFEYYPSKLSKYFLYSNMICHQAWFVSSKYYNSSQGYDIRFRFHSDYSFLLKMVLEDKINYIHVPEVLVTYKGGGISQGLESKIELRESNWNEFVIKKHFTPLERKVFSFFLFVRNRFKIIFYDHFFSKIWVIYLESKRKRID
jgi:glycosyltransferase involved in cell wall biosynthesis